MKKFIAGLLGIAVLLVLPVGIICTATAAPVKQITTTSAITPQVVYFCAYGTDLCDAQNTCGIMYTNFLVSHPQAILKEAVAVYNPANNDIECSWIVIY